MPDSPETRQLKEINRHLSDIQKGQLTDIPTPSETANVTKNVREMMSNFEQLLDTRLKKVILTTDRTFEQTFGNLKGFQMDQNQQQINALEEIIDDLEWNNKILDKQSQNEFLREQEREKDLSINMRTNDLLEDILEKEDVREKEGKGFLDKAGGFLAGIFGGAGAGALLRGGLAFLGKAALAAGLVGLVAFGAKSFLEGWQEAGEDATFGQKLSSALGKALDDLTFGLFGKDFFSNMFDGIEKQIKKALDNIKAIWNDASKDFGEKFDETIAQLSLGLFSPGDIENFRAKTYSMLESLNKGINDLVKEQLGFDLNQVVQDFYAGVDKIIDDTILLFTDPFELIAKKMRESREKSKKEIKEAAERAKIGDISQLEDDELLELYATGELTPAQRQARIKQAEEMAAESEAFRKGFVEFFKNVFDWGKEGVERVAEESDKLERERIGMERFKARQDKAAQERADKLKREAMEAEREKARKPEPETGLFGPRPFNNVVNSTNVQNINREDTSTINDDRSLAIQQTN